MIPFALMLPSCGTNNSKTKAVIAVNLFGSPADLTGLVGFKKSRNFLIEDNAQAITAKQEVNILVL